MYDAEGSYEGLPCPDCGSLETVSYHYEEGFSELECPRCGYLSDALELAELARFGGALLETPQPEPLPVPIKPLKA